MESSMKCSKISSNILLSLYWRGDFEDSNFPTLTQWASWALPACWMCPPSLLSKGTDSHMALCTGTAHLRSWSPYLLTNVCQCLCPQKHRGSCNSPMQQCSGVAAKTSPKAVAAAPPGMGYCLPVWLFFGRCSLATLPHSVLMWFHGPCYDPQHEVLPSSSHVIFKFPTFILWGK